MKKFSFALLALILSLSPLMISQSAHAHADCWGDQHGDGNGNCVPNDPTKDPNWPGNGGFAPGNGDDFAHGWPPGGFRGHACYSQDRNGHQFRGFTSRQALNNCLYQSYAPRTCRAIGCN